MVGSAREHVIRLEDCVPERLDLIGHEAFYEASNLNRIVAFVGSGISLVYGSLTWKDFMRSIVDLAKAGVQAAQEALSEHQVPRTNAESTHLTRALAVSLRQLELYGKQDDDSIVTLELCQQAFQIVEKVYLGAGSAGTTPLSFGTALQSVFRSDSYFVRRALNRRLRLAGIEEPQSALSRPVDGAKSGASPRTADEHTTRAASGFYSLTTLRFLAEGDTNLSTVLDRFTDAASWNAKSKSDALPIDRRSLINIFLAKYLIRQGVFLKSDNVRSVHDSTIELANPRPLLDPIHNLSRDLGVKRYLTTNYDIELEQYFMLDDVRDRSPLPLDFERLPTHGGTIVGDAAPTEHAWLRDRSDGSQVMSELYSPGSSASLVNFAIGGRANAVSIYHLHGRADVPSSMVATESDYNRLYWRSGQHRQGLDHAYEVLLAGNPILFVGSGLSEIELTRTLRQQVSDARRREDAFELRPAFEKAAELVTIQTNRRTKFSVHTLHYGHPRRGRGVSLRRHQIAIDMVARKFGIKKEQASEEWARDRTDKLDQGLLEAAAAGLCDPEASPLSELPRSPEMEYDLADAACVAALGSRAYDRLDRTISDPDSYGHELNLIASLDFDAEVFGWLLSASSCNFATELRNSEQYSEPARALIAEYLTKLDEKVVSAALRVELRELAREKNRFFLDRTTIVEKRAVRLPELPDSKKVFVRHVTVAPDLMLRAPEYWREISVAKDGELVAEEWRKLRLDKANTDVSRFKNRATLIVGQSGCGKGALLRQLVTCSDQLVGDHRKAEWSSALFINCCFGHEFDSVVTLVDAFLSRDEVQSREAEALSHASVASRRERIEKALDARAGSGTHSGKRELIMFGAIDRLFGLEGELLSSECHWLFSKLLQSTAIDVIMTGSDRVLNYARMRYQDVMKQDEGAEHRLSDRLRSRWHSRPARQMQILEVSRDEQSFLTQLKTQWEDREWKAGHLDVVSGQHQDEIAEQSQHAVRDAPKAMRLSSSRKAHLTIEREYDALMHSPQGRPWNRDFGALAQEIVKVLAFIGLPTEGEVLWIPPRIRDMIDLVVNSPECEKCTLDTLTLQDAAFIAALNVLISRQLISTVEPYGFAQATPFKTKGDASMGDAQTELHSDLVALFECLHIEIAEDPELRRAFAVDGDGRTAAQHAILHRHRFALHRNVIAFIRSRHNVPIGETTLSDCFNLSLYTAQPDDIPTPRPQLAGELAELADWLRCAWKDVKLHEDAIEKPLKKFEKDTLANGYSKDPLVPTRVRRIHELRKLMKMRGSLAPASLRAAGGLVRSFFSAASLFGLDVTDSYGRPTSAGAITQHKQRLREILSTAYLMQTTRDTDENNFNAKWQSLLHSKVTIPDQAVVGTAVTHEYPLFDSGDTALVTKILGEFSKTQPWDKPESEQALAWQTGRYDTHAIIPRWAELAGAAKGSPCETFRSDGASNDQPPANDLTRRPFYSEEITWMHNERGVVALGQGDLYAAQTSFFLAQQSNSRIEGSEYQPNRCRILLNVALVQIERGRIRETWHELKRMRDALDPNRRRQYRTIDSRTREFQTIVALADGYMGLCEHLNGQVDKALASYNRSLEILTKNGEQRAFAILCAHKASLLQSAQHDYVGAHKHFQRALAAVESGPHTDIIYSIQVGMVGLRSSPAARAENLSQKHPELLQTLDRAIHYGELLDMYRVSASALAVRATLRRDLGDVEAAELDIARAMAIASRCGMKLRRMALQVQKGRVFETIGETENARYLYQMALGDAETYGYQQGIHVAREGLKRLR